MDEGKLPGPVGHLKAISEEEDGACSAVEGHPEQPCPPATEPRSVPESGRPLQALLMEQASRDASLKGIIRPCYVLLERLPMHLLPKTENSARPPSRNTTAQPKHGFATGVEEPVKEVQFADAACAENAMDACSLAAVPAPAQSARKPQNTQPAPLAAPTGERKHYLCVWCKERFKLQISLEVHYRYCLQKRKQPWLKAGGSSSTGASADAVFPLQNPAQGPSSNKGGRAFSGDTQWQPLQRQSVIKYQAMMEARKRTIEKTCKLAATTCTVKKRWRCVQCEEKFVYKWRFIVHLQNCKGNVPGKNQLPPEPQGSAPREISDSAEAEEPCAAPVAGPSTSKQTTLYPCKKCGNISGQCYIPTHRAYHKGEKYKCLWCGKILYYWRSALRHKQLHYKNEEVCSTCRKPAAEKECICMIQKISPDGQEQSKPEDPK